MIMRGINTWYLGMWFLRGCVPLCKHHTGLATYTTGTNFRWWWLEGDFVTIVDRQWNTAGDSSPTGEPVGSSPIVVISPEMPVVESFSDVPTSIQPPIATTTTLVPLPVASAKASHDQPVLLRQSQRPKTPSVLLCDYITHAATIDNNKPLSHSPALQFWVFVFSQRYISLSFNEISCWN